MAGKIEAYGANCTIHVPYEGENLNKLRGFPGFKKPLSGTRKFIFRPTSNNIKYIQENFPDVEWSEDTAHIITRFIQEQIEAQSSLEQKKSFIEDDGSYEYKTEPMDHQRHCFLLSRDKKYFAFFMEQGTGKTKVLIDTAAYLYAQGKIDGLIVIAPNGVHANFVEVEAKIHFPDWLDWDAFVYSSNMTVRKKEEFERVIASTEKLRIFAFNVEGFVSDKAKMLLERILRTLSKPMTGIDESQYLKNSSAKRTKYLTKTLKHVPYGRIMTGTNVTKGIEDLYGQFTALDKEILGFDSFYTFRNHFCVMGGYEMREIVGYKNIDELSSLIDPYSYRVLKKDCLDIPPKQYKRWVVEMTPKQKSLYNSLKDDFYADLGENRLTAELGIVRLLRLQQITCGWFPSDDEEVAQRIPGDNPKLEAVRQHCKDTAGSVIIWARFSKDIELIQEQLNKDHGSGSAEIYYGGTPQDDRMDLVRNFQEKKYPYLVAHAKAAGRGLTLTACNDPIYHSCDFDLELRLQSEDRCHRKGTEGQVTYTDVEAKGTVDRRINKSLVEKKNIADLINKDPHSVFMEEINEA